MDRDLAPCACAVSTIAFISSKVTVCVVSTLSKLPRDPYTLIQSDAALDAFLGRPRASRRDRARRRRAPRVPGPTTNIRGPDHRAHRDEVAHREIGFVRRAEIADRRDAGLERAARVVLGEEHRDRRPAPLAERPRPGLAIPVST